MASRQTLILFSRLAAGASLAYAMADAEIAGVWGGTTERERRKLRSAVGRTPFRVHSGGSPSPSASPHAPNKAPPQPRERSGGMAGARSGGKAPTWTTYRAPLAGRSRIGCVVVAARTSRASGPLGSVLHRRFGNLHRGGRLGKGDDLGLRRVGGNGFFGNGHAVCGTRHGRD